MFARVILLLAVLQVIIMPFNTANAGTNKDERRSGKVLFKHGGSGYKNKNSTSLNNNNSTGGRNTSGNAYYKQCLVNGVWVSCFGTYTPRPTTTCPPGFRCLGRITASKKKVFSKKSTKSPLRNDPHKDQ